MNAPHSPAAKPRANRLPATGSGDSRAGLMLPWLLAPAWMFLPIGGCGLAKAMLKPPTTDARPIGSTAAVEGENVPVGSTMTVLPAPGG